MKNKELYGEAKKFVIENQKCTSAALEVHLNIDKETANTLIKSMQEDGVIGTPNSKNQYEVLIPNTPQPQTPNNREGKSAHQQALDMAEETKQEEIRETLKLDEPAPPGSIIIHKAKITKADTLEVEYSRDGDVFSIKKKGKVHDDLKNAFEKLVPHAAMLTDLKEVKKLASIYDDCVIIGKQNLRVSSFHLSGKTNSDIILTLIKQINNNKQIVINSPLTEMASENEPYPFSGYLSKTIEECKDEVIDYLNGKYAEDPQMALELSETEETEF